MLYAIIPDLLKPTENQSIKNEGRSVKIRPEGKLMDVAENEKVDSLIKTQMNIDKIYLCRSLQIAAFQCQCREVFRY